MDKRYTVFVSSTFKDLIDARWAVAKALMRLNLVPLGMEAFTASDLNQWEIIKKTIDLSDYYVLILGSRYGEIDKETGMSYTEKEYRYAISKGIPCLSFLTNTNVPVLPEHVETDEHRQKLAIFRSEVSSRRMVDFWSNPDELAGKALTAVHLATLDSPRPGWIRNPQLNTDVIEEMARLSRRNSELEEEVRRLRESVSVDPQLQCNILSLNEHGVLYLNVASLRHIREMAYESQREEAFVISKSPLWKQESTSMGTIIASALARSSPTGLTYKVDSARISIVEAFLKRYGIDTADFDWNFDLTGSLRINSSINGVPISTIEPVGGKDYNKYKLFLALEQADRSVQEFIRKHTRSSTHHNIKFSIENTGRIAARDVEITISFTNSSTNEGNVFENPLSVTTSVPFISPGAHFNINNFDYILDGGMHYSSGAYEEVIRARITGSNIPTPLYFNFPIQVEVYD